jgi:dTMP kinase
MSQGCFVVLEGPEGGGKTTLHRGLIERVRAAGANPVAVREPGGTPAAEALRSELLDADRPWTPELELLYVTTARADLVNRIIRPALEGGRLVLSDRYEMSTRAYQGAGRGVDPVHLEWVNRAATGGLVPDLTIVLDLDPEAGMERLRSTGRHQNRLDQESLEFHRRVAEFYRGATGPGIVHLDARETPAALLEASFRAIHTLRPDLVRSL